MKAFVNDACIGCGLCVNTCPAVFQMTDEGVAVASAEAIGPELEDEVLSAQSGCPVNAIEVS